MVQVLHMEITTMSMMMEVSEVIKSDGDDDDDDEYDNDGGK